MQACMEMVDNMARKGYQIGTASVRAGAPCPDAGARMTGRSNGCTHDHCTAAKKQAVKELIKVVDPSCHDHISATKPCKKVNC